MRCERKDKPIKLKVLREDTLFYLGQKCNTQIVVRIKKSKELQNFIETVNFNNYFIIHPFVKNNKYYEMYKDDYFKLKQLINNYQWNNKFKNIINE